MPIAIAFLHRVGTAGFLISAALVSAVLPASMSTAGPPSTYCVRPDSATTIACISATPAAIPTGVADNETVTTDETDTILPNVGDTTPSGMHGKIFGGSRAGKRVVVETQGVRPNAKIFGFCPAPTDKPLST